MDSKALIGWVVILINIASAVAVFSQVRLTYHRKNTIGLSLWPWAMGTSNAVIGTLYSILIADFFFLIANLAWSLANGTMLMLVLYYGSRTVKSNTGVQEQ